MNLMVSKMVKKKTQHNMLKWNAASVQRRRHWCVCLFVLYELLIAGLCLELALSFTSLCPELRYSHDWCAAAPFFRDWCRSWWEQWSLGQFDFHPSLSFTVFFSYNHQNLLKSGICTNLCWKYNFLTLSASKLYYQNFKLRTYARNFLLILWEHSFWYGNFR